MYMLKTDSWFLERTLYLIAGAVVLLSVALSVLVSPYWLILTAFVGINLVLFAFTGFCLMANIVARVSSIKPRMGR
jgi:Zn-dependent protease